MKNFSRRHFLAAPLLLLPAARYAAASGYPNRAIRIVVGFQAGGTADVFARIIAAKAAPILGQAVIVDNKPGVGAILGADHVAKSAPDGYTLFLTFSEALISNTALYKNLPYHPARDFSFITMVATGPLVIVVNKNIPAQDLRELVSHAKSGVNINFGSWGQGSHGHLLAEALNKKYGIKMEHVAYKGETPVIQDLLGGQIDIAAGSIGNMAPHIKSGALKAIGVIGLKVNPALPTVPTLASQGATDISFTTLGWVGLVGPARLSFEITSRLGEVMREVLAMPDVKSRLKVYGFETKFLARDDFYKVWQRDLALWTKLITDAGVSLD